MAYTRKQWATALLAAIGNTNPNPITVNWVVAWTQHETACCGGCAYNLLNTTETNTPGALGRCGTNSANVQQYDSFTNGILANAKVLMNGLYGGILAALRNNDTNALCNPGSDIQANLGTWGTGGGSAASIAQAACSGNVAADQSFTGDPTTVTPAVTTTTPTSSDPIKTISDFFQNISGIADWIKNPTRIVKFLFGFWGLSLSLIIIFWPEIKQTVATTANVAKTAALA